MYGLFILLLSSLFGLVFYIAFDPIVLLSRSLAILLFPWISTAGNALLGLLQPVAMRFGWISLMYATFQEFYFHHVFFILILFGALLFLTWLVSRFWCRYLCPLGGLLSIFAARAPFRRIVDGERCISCSKCARECVTGAIDPNTFESDRKECIECYNCVSLCPTEAIRFRWTGPLSSPTVERFNLSRRGFIASIVAALGGVVLMTEGRRKDLSAGVVRPPGSLPEDLFLETCLRCGKCMKGCITSGLQPCLVEAGVSGIFTPRLVSRIGGCEDKCNLCGQICPSGAIRALPLEEKRFVKMGTAVIVRSLCIVWEQKRKCLICDEACPYDAIEWRIVTDSEGEFPRPFVLEEKCTGCGLCEERCPLTGKAAIVVLPHGEERIRSGSYITERKKKLREVPKDEKMKSIVECWDWGECEP
jgi:ferredoxin